MNALGFTITTLVSTLWICGFAQSLLFFGCDSKIGIRLGCLCVCAIHKASASCTSTGIISVSFRRRVQDARRSGLDCRILSRIAYTIDLWTSERGVDY